MDLKKKELVDFVDSILSDNGIDLKSKIVFNKKLKSYRAKAVIYKDRSIKILEFRLNSEYLDVDNDIIKGLLISLLRRLKKSIVIEEDFTALYNSFIKNISECDVGSEDQDPELMASFKRVNDKYFNSDMMIPKLVWGNDSVVKLASYSLFTNTVTVSTVFRGIDNNPVLDFLMYHELLHKFLKFDESKKVKRYHTKQFRDLEEQYENYDAVNSEISRIVSNYKRRRTKSRKVSVPKKKKGLLDFFFS